MYNNTKKDSRQNKRCPYPKRSKNMIFITEFERIYSAQGDKVLAEITFPEKGVNTFCIDHTFVDDSLRGQGVASKLVQMAVNEIKSRGGKVTATCSYAAHWLEKNGIENNAE